MELTQSIWDTPLDFLRAHQPESPVLLFAPEALQAKAQEFIAGFPGMVTYAVKSNPDPMVVANLAAAGIRGFDVASPAEIEMVSALAPDAAMHFNNPVRSRKEIAFARDHGVVSYSVDSRTELAKLMEIVPPDAVPGGVEITARFKLPVQGAAYNFGAKFGATKELAAELLAEIAAHGYRASLTFHPGTQCSDPSAWESYIHAAADIAKGAGVRIERLNVGGGYPSHRDADKAPPLADIFATIDRATTEAFGADRPQLVCEPGRGLVGDAFALIAQIKAIRDDRHVFLNDGIYGALAESAFVGMPDRIEVYSPEGKRRTGGPVPRVTFGPTCDSVDKLPGEPVLPSDAVEGDFIVVHGMGAYTTVTNTRFNGFGDLTISTARQLA